MLSYQTFTTFTNFSILTLCCFINFCHLIKPISSCKTFVIFSPFLIYSLFALSTHPINVPAQHTTNNNSFFCLIVRTLSALIYISNSPGAFAILTMGGSDRGWGLPHRTNRYVSLASTCPLHWLLLILLRHPFKPAYFVSTPLA